MSLTDPCAHLFWKAGKMKAPSRWLESDSSEDPRGLVKHYTAHQKSKLLTKIILPDGSWAENCDVSGRVGP